MNKISVCIIAKNEEKFISNCLKAAKEYGVELVVVDTGSEDETVKIAKEFTEKVFYFEWCNDFSAARNYAAKMAKNDYILALDCDEVLEAFDGKEIEWLLDNYPNAIGNINITNVLRDSLNEQTENYGKIARVYDRRFVHFEGKVHEQLRKIGGGELGFGDLSTRIRHWGYYYENEEQQMAKNKRDALLLEEEVKSNPTNPYLWFQLGQSNYGMKNYKEALQCQKKALSFNPPVKAPYTELLIIDFGATCHELKTYNEALKIEEYYDDFCELADYMYLLGKTYLNIGKWEDAILAFELALNCKKVRFEGTNSYLSFWGLSETYEKMGNTEMVEKYKNLAMETKANR